MVVADLSSPLQSGFLTVITSLSPSPTQFSRNRAQEWSLNIICLSLSLSSHESKDNAYNCILFDEMNVCHADDTFLNVEMVLSRDHICLKLRMCTVNVKCSLRALLSFHTD